MYDVDHDAIVLSYCGCHCVQRAFESVQERHAAACPSSLRWPPSLRTGEDSLSGCHCGRGGGGDTRENLCLH